MAEQMSEEQRKELEEKIKNMSPEELREFQKQQCIFCQIIAGKVPAKKVYEDEHCVAVLDINPAAKGHLLLIPKDHYAIMPQIPEKEITHLFLAAKYLSQVVLKSLHVDGTNLFIANGLAAGQRSQHFMLHLIPRKQGDKILEFQEKVLDGELRRKIKTAVEKRLNELLGIKKEIVDLPEKKEEPEEEPITQKASTGGKTMKSNVKKKSDEDDDDDDFEEEKNVSLDDIANLFK